MYFERYIRQVAACFTVLVWFSFVFLVLRLQFKFKEQFKLRNLFQWVSLSHLSQECGEM